ncbi:MAG: AsnC family transcriptional regulator [Candidatus Nanoarchaeia archaeon]|nr:AsnC family transcriptional regulator [Candidatus Nanoarchaeia archaeon]
MTLKLDLKNIKILNILNENARYSNSQIAKKVKLSKPAVEYRINRLEKNNVIFEYYTILNFTKLGLSQYKSYFKFQNLTSEDEERIINYWLNLKDAIWVVQTRGRWDLTVSFLAKSNYEFGKILREFMNIFSNFILDKEILMTESSSIYPRKYLGETKPLEFVYGIPIEIYRLDEIDKKILKELSTNSRISIVNLVKKTKLTRDIISYRLRKLAKENIIIKFGCELNLQNIGVKYYKLMVRTKNFNDKAEQRLKIYVSNHKRVVQILKLIGSWDIEIEFETETEDELYQTLTELRKEFSSIIKDFDILRLIKVHKYNYFPF